MICSFCHFDFADAARHDMLVTRCPEHKCEVCPQCYACQKAGPILFSSAGRILRAMYGEET